MVEFDIDRVFAALLTGWQLKTRVDEPRLTGNSLGNYGVLTDVKRVHICVYISKIDRIDENEFDSQR